MVGSGDLVVIIDGNEQGAFPAEILTVHITSGLYERLGEA